MAIRNELEYFFGAIRFFTRLPVPAWVGHSSEALERSSRYFPAVGLIVGGIAALVFALTSFFWPKTLAILSAMAITLYVTGAFHEDGWSDMVDGFGGGWEKSQILTIMKDSRIGSFGAVALVMMLLTKFFALVEIERLLLPVTLIAGHAFSRLCATLVLRRLDYVRDEGKAKPLSTHIGTGELAFAAITALLPLLLLPPQQSIPGVVLALLATVWLARLFKRRIGGYTGDCLGATQQLAEVAFYGGLLCRFS
jgi:adenosylcobinamide-GDP ribazoletransferase